MNEIDYCFRIRHCLGVAGIHCRQCDRPAVAGHGVDSELDVPRRRLDSDPRHHDVARHSAERHPADHRTGYNDCLADCLLKMNRIWVEVELKSKRGKNPKGIIKLRNKIS